MAALDRVNRFFPLTIGVFCVLGWLVAKTVGAPVWGVAVPLVVAATWHWPELFFLFILFSIPFARSPQSTWVTPDQIALFKTGLAILVVIVWGVREGRHSRLGSFPPWVKTLGLLWVGLIFLSVLANGWSTATGQSLFFFAGTAAVFWRVGGLSQQSQRRIVLVLLLAALGAAFFGVVQYILVTQHIFPQVWPVLLPRSTIAFIQEGGLAQINAPFRVQAAFTHPNQLGIFLAIALPVTAALTGVKAFPTAIKRGLLGTTAIVALGLFLTNSRGSIAAGALGTAFVGCQRGGRWIWVSALGLALSLALACIVSGTSIGPILDRYLRKDHLFSGREVIWKNGWDLIARSPAWGWGPGNIPEQYVDHFGYFVYHDANEQREQQRLLMTAPEGMTNSFHLHNTYLQVAGELGLPALGLYILALTFSFWQLARQTYSLRPGTWRWAIRRGAAGVIVVLAIYGLFDAPLVFRLLAVGLSTAPLVAMGLSEPFRRPLTFSKSIGAASP